MYFGPFILSIYYNVIKYVIIFNKCQQKYQSVVDCCKTKSIDNLTQHRCSAQYLYIKSLLWSVKLQAAVKLQKRLILCDTIAQPINLLYVVFNMEKDTFCTLSVTHSKDTRQYPDQITILINGGCFLSGLIVNTKLTSTICHISLESNTQGLISVGPPTKNIYAYVPPCIEVFFDTLFVCFGVLFFFKGKSTLKKLTWVRSGD